VYKVNKVMIDFETLDTTPSSVAFSVGLCFFDEKRVFADMHINLNIQQQIEAGRTISADTLKFWMGQPALYAQLTTDPVDVQKGLSLISKKFREYEVQEIWGNGASFDMPILDTLMSKREKPYSFRSSRCYRTLKNLFTEAELEGVIGDVTNPQLHHPKYDAIHQAKCTILLLNQLTQMRRAYASNTTNTKP